MLNVRAMLENNRKKRHTERYVTLILGKFIILEGYICSAV
ncbi:MAG: hypothetical protein RL647_1139 [Bacteroidota bacterium]|jgi:hypothetical protein